MCDWRRDLGEAVAGCAAELRFAEPMARHTTFRIGGLADAWVRVDDRQALVRVLEACRQARLPTWLLGRGSNVLVSDQGLRGVVICLGGKLAGIQRRPSSGQELSGTRITGDGTGVPLLMKSALICGAGAALDDVARFADEEALDGAAFLAGIPGTIGGGLHSNAGAFGRSLGDIVASVAVLDHEGRESVLAATQIRREYRRPMIDDGLVAVEATLELTDAPRLPNGDGDARIEGRMTAAQVREKRWAKHPGEPSAGSFFRNPEKDGERIPAGRIIEQCGLKGRTIGGARVSDEHANFVINTGRARFTDVYELVQIVKATVEEQTGILLEEEVQYLPGPNDGRRQGHAADSRQLAADPRR